MPRIILASASPQRKKLLQRLGIEFSVIPSRIKEIKHKKTTCSHLVKANALLKAQDIAAKVKEGIVIGADSLVYMGNGKVVGKPKNFKEAKKILKILMAEPHWVYTGLAVVDAKSGKTLVDYEKTKIYMSPLSDQEIDRYHRRMNPLDKAGGFDIEGWGGSFIRRIEGCYFNVIGLPMAKLCRMLKKIGAPILMVFLLAAVTGCSTEYNLATNQHETLMYGDEKENQIGAAISKQFEKNSKLDTEVDINERVDRITRRIAQVCDRKEVVYIAKVIDEDKMNAVSLPGGYIYVYKGLTDKVDNDDQLAAVIAHEVGHITARHAIKRLQAMYGYTFLQLLVVGSGNANVSRGVDAAFLSVFLAYSRGDEFQADKLGIKYMKKAGYNPEELPKMLKKLKEFEDKEPLREYSYWRTHPYLSQRISAANKIISGQLEFKDYLNLTGEDK